MRSRLSVFGCSSGFKVSLRFRASGLSVLCLACQGLRGLRVLESPSLGGQGLQVRLSGFRVQAFFGQQVHLSNLNPEAQYADASQNRQEPSRESLKYPLKYPLK